MTETTHRQERTYRLAPIDSTGLLLGLSGTQCGILAAAILLAGLLLQAGVHPVATIVPLVAGCAVAFGTWGGHRIPEHVPIVVRHVANRWLGLASWRAPLPGLTGTARDRTRQPHLPPWLDGIEVHDSGPGGWAVTPVGIGVLLDRRGRTASASLEVRGREFALLEREAQERILAGWGDVLGGFCGERGAVSRVRVTEWAAPAGTHRGSAGDLDAKSTSREARASYEALLDEAGAMAVEHEVVFTVTVDLRRLRGSRRDGEGLEARATTALVEELRLLANRLDAAGLPPGPPLSAGELGWLLRTRMDPSLATRSKTRPRTLAQAVSPWNCGPLASDVERDHIRVDGWLHRSYWLGEWPRLEVGPNWLEPVLLHAGGVRTFAVHYVPVPPSRSRRRIERDSTRLAADEEQRTRTGFRIGAAHRRAQAAVLEREAELVAGFPELEYFGFVVVSAPTPDELDRSCAEHEQLAAQHGIELRALDGQHDLGLVCALPLGRGLIDRRGLR